MSLRFKDHVRPYYLEEPLDFLFFRPAALFLLTLLQKTPVMPNHVSLFALVLALVSGHFLAQGTEFGFWLGGLGILVFSVLDCCDGMLSRLRNLKNLVGEPLDMFVDMMAAIAFFTGLSLGLSRSAVWSQFWYLPLLSGVVILVHAGAYQFHKKLFFFHRDGAQENLANHLKDFTTLRDQLRREQRNLFHRFLISFYLFFHESRVREAGPVYPFSSANYVEKNRTVLPYWALTAGSTHLGILGVSLLLNQLGLFFVYSLCLSHIILFVSFVKQQGVMRQLKSESGRMA